MISVTVYHHSQCQFVILFSLPGDSALAVNVILRVPRHYYHLRSTITRAFNRGAAWNYYLGSYLTTQSYQTSCNYCVCKNISCDCLCCKYNVATSLSSVCVHQLFLRHHTGVNFLVVSYFDMIMSFGWPSFENFCNA